MSRATMTRRGFLKSTAAMGAAGALGISAADSLTAVDPAHADEASDVKIVKTSCRACIASCAVLAHVRDGRVVKIEGNPESPMSQGGVCAKGLAGIQALYHPNRNKYPMRRVGERGTNQWERISWEEALTEVATKINEISDKYGSEAISVSTGGGGNPHFSNVKRFGEAINTPNVWEPGCSQCYLPRMGASLLAYGAGKPNNLSFSDSNGWDYYYTDSPVTSLVLWGTDPSNSSVATGGRALAELRNRPEGLRTVVIDPRYTLDAAKAEVWLPIRPGTDVAMTNGWARYIIENKLYDEAWCVKWTNLPFLVNEETMLLYHADELGLGEATDYVVWDANSNSAKAMPWPQDETLSPVLDGEFEVNGKKSRTAFRAVWDNCAEWTLEKTAEVTWCTPEAIEEAVKIYAEGSPHSGISIGVATDQYAQSAQVPEGVTIIESLMGNACHQGNTIQSRKNQSLGTYFLFPFNLFGPTPLSPTEEVVRRRLGVIEHKGLNYWMALHIPTIMEAMNTGEPYQPEMWIDRSGNKLAMVGDATTFLEAMKKMKFIVHMYMYPTTTSIELADMILPTAEWLETAYGADRCNVWLIRRDVVHTFEHVDETLIWSWIVSALADRGHKEAQMAFDAENCGMAGPYWKTYDEYKGYLAAFMSQSFGEQWTWDECCEKLPAEFMPMEEWITSTYESYEKPGEDGNPTGFATTSHRMEPYGEAMTIMGRTGGPAGASFWDNYVLPPASVDYLPLPRYEEPAESPVTDTEFPYVLTEGRVPMYHHGTLRNVPWIREMYPVPQTWVNPVTAAEIGVEEGDWCFVESRRGKIQGRIHITEGIAPKVIYQERFWNPECYDESQTNPTAGWRECNVNVLTKNDAPFNEVYGSYTNRGFTVKIEKSERPERVWVESEQFEPFMPTLQNEPVTEEVF